MIDLFRRGTGNVPSCNLLNVATRAPEDLFYLKAPIFSLVTFIQAFSPQSATLVTVIVMRVADCFLNAYVLFHHFE